MLLKQDLIDLHNIPSRMRNLIIADNQDISRIGVESIAAGIIGISGINTATDKSSLIKQLSSNNGSLIILDYTLFDFSSVNEIQILQERYTESSWILFCDELSDSFLRQVIVHDLYFSIIGKMNSSHEIKNAIETALMYDKYISTEIENHLRLLKHSLESSADYNLTASEKEILKEMASGKTTKEIAATRNISFHTVTTHRKNIFRKLQVSNVQEAIRYAIKAGIADLSDYYI